MHIYTDTYGYTHLEHHAGVPALERGILPVCFATQRAALGFSTCVLRSGQRCCRLELLAGFLQRQRAGLVRLVFPAQDPAGTGVMITPELACLLLAFFR